MKKMMITLALLTAMVSGAAFAAQACCPKSACCGSMQDCCQ
jgi:hypothetical protein